MSAEPLSREEREFFVEEAIKSPYQRIAYCDCVATHERAERADYVQLRADDFARREADARRAVVVESARADAAEKRTERLRMGVLEMGSVSDDEWTQVACSRLLAADDEARAS